MSTLVNINTRIIFDIIDVKLRRLKKNVRGKDYQELYNDIEVELRNHVEFLIGRRKNEKSEIKELLFSISQRVADEFSTAINQQEKINEICSIISNNIVPKLIEEFDL